MSPRPSSDASLSCYRGSLLILDKPNETINEIRAAYSLTSSRGCVIEYHQHPGTVVLVIRYGLSQ